MKKQISCTICGSKNINTLLGIYYFCKNCQSAWIKKIPPTEYNESYYKGELGIASILFKPIQLFFYWIRRNYISGNKIRTWIDVGAGAGEFLKTVRAEKKIGVEISKVGRKMMEKEGLLTFSDSEFLKEESLDADVISFWHMLEHTSNPEQYLLAAKRNLVPSGQIIIGIPNINSLEFRLFKQYWFHLDPSHHNRHFSPKSLAKILKKTGFKIKKIDYWSLEHHPAGILQSFINITTHSDNILHRLVKRKNSSPSFNLKDIVICLFWLTLGLPVVILFWIISAFTHYSGSLVVVAQKKSS